MVRSIMILMMAGGVLIGLLLFIAGKADLILGFALGVTASLLNCLLLGRQMNRMVELPVEKAVALIQSGWLFRLSLALLLLALSNVFSQVNFLAALAGFFLFQIFLIIRAVLSLVRNWQKD